MIIIKIDQEIGYWGISASQIKRELKEASGDIKIEINSPGGSVIEGIAIYNAIKDYDKGNVEIVIIGLAASMASYIALAGDKITAYDNAIYMIHNAWGIAIGDYREMEKRSKVLNGMSGILRKSYINKTNKSEKDITKAMDDETYYIGQEMLDNGFIDEIISTDNEKDNDTALALAKEQFNGCIKNLETNAKDEDITQIAAHVKDCTGNCPISDVVENPTASAGKTESKNEEMEMTKDSQDPTKETQPTAEASTVAADAVAGERKRVASIMALTGNSEVKELAIKDGFSVGDAAIALNDAMASQAQTQKAGFEDAAQEVAGVETEAQAAQAENEEDKAWKDAEDAHYKKGAK